MQVRILPALAITYESEVKSMSRIDLSNLADGAVAERFNIEIQRVLENIADPNTDPKKARKLTMTLTIKADEQRDIASVTIEAKPTLVPAKGVETKFVIDKDKKGRVVGAELKSGAKNQMMIDNDGDLADDRGNKVQTDGSKVVQFK